MSSPLFNLISEYQKQNAALKNVKPLDSKSCSRYITYFMVYLSFIVSFYCVYKKSVYLLGVLLLYLTNIIYSILLTKDLFESPKKNTDQVITMIIFSIIVLNAVSSTIVISTIRAIHLNYSKKDEQIQISKKTRALLSVYIAMFITTIIILFFLSIFYFIEPLDVRFFNYNFNGKTISPYLLLISFIIKILTSMTAVGLSGYMIFASTVFSNTKIKSID